MGMFNDLLSKIFRHASTGSLTGEAPAAPAASTPAAPTPGGAQPGAGAVTSTAETSEAAKAAPAPVVPPTVDVAGILDGLAAENPERLDWKRSIVDLLKLVGMDSSLAARKTLAGELHYPGNQGDSAEMNLWLHKEVLKQLAQNGGKLPPGLLES
jgi:hypothetical protein